MLHRRPGADVPGFERAYGALDSVRGDPPPRETNWAAYGARELATHHGATNWDWAAYGSLDTGGSPLLRPATTRLVG